ncbi:phosphatidylserine decarboxylase [Theileria orientalis]|uniref:Phosphatidylserine decarboxylase n=1 Tax=Theileria orientalis TaxID=68886 RepID=A0A976QQU3_THEOR|nr:phosphatidylserine decarboxylase [Theileria orientalis]
MRHFPISKHGLGYIGVPLFLSLLSFAFSEYLAFFFIFLTILVTYFFRDPKRLVPDNDSLVLSPADGVVTSVEVVDSPLGDGTRLNRVSVFLNVLNVHVNRSPVTGVVKSVKYKPGEFLNALKEESVARNEMIRTVFLSQYGNYTLITEQLAGLIAKRAVCDLQPGDEVKVGSRMGMIKFGSRVNTYFPLDVKPLVVKGQPVSAGQTLFAYLDPKLSEGSQDFKYDKI